MRKSPIWVSAVTHGKTTTLSGRPSILQDFVSLNGSKLKSRYLDIESPFHAAHLFEGADIDEIISHSTSDIVLQQTPLLPLLSSSTGDVIEASTFGGLLKSVVREALQEPIRWDLILTSYRNILSKSSAQKCSILPFSSNASSMVSIALSKENSVEVSVEDGSNSQYSVPPSMPTGHFEDSRIAIVGYSGRFPSAESNEKFWELLKAGRDVHREIPEDRFNWRTHMDPSGKKKNSSKVKYGCFIDEPGVFDTRFFNMSPKEAENTDPAQRLAITTTYEAMEMAGMVRNRTPSTQQDRVGVFFGTTSDDWREVNSGQDVGTYFIPGGNRAFVPGRISYFFRFSGPSLSVDTACSSRFCGYSSSLRVFMEGRMRYLCRWWHQRPHQSRQFRRSRSMAISFPRQETVMPLTTKPVDIVVLMLSVQSSSNVLKMPRLTVTQSSVSSSGLIQTIAARPTASPDPMRVIKPASSSVSCVTQMSILLTLATSRCTVLARKLATRRR